MVISRKITVIFILFLTFTSQAISKNLYDEHKTDNIRNKKLYKNVEINSIENHNNEGALTYRITVNAINKNNFENMHSSSNKKNSENILWDISTNLPLTEAQCNAAYADLCDKNLNELYKGSCFKPCISYGPEPLDFDEKNNWNKENMQLHYFSNIIWLSNTMFSYYDGIRNSKFKNSFEEIKESVYDINSKSLVRSRILSKHERDSVLY